MRPVYYLAVFIPLAIVLKLADAPDTADLLRRGRAGVIPAAALMGEATEEIAARPGPGIGGLLNVTFGNAPELIIAFFALGKGLQEVVKASIVGSIVGNVLLVLGAAMLVGGWAPREAGLQPHGRACAVGDAAAGGAAVVLPAIFELVRGRRPARRGRRARGLRPEVETVVGGGVVLLLSYVGGPAVLAPYAP